MGKTAREMAGEKVDEVIAELNKALADEWLAYIQYLGGAALVPQGPVAGELASIAKEELEHAEELTGRIIQLGGKPIVDPKDFLEKTNCGYEVPNSEASKVLADAIKGEGCAIKVYHKIAMMVKDSDPVTYELMLHIMGEEMEHEEKFETLKAWLG